MSQGLPPCSSDDVRMKADDGHDEVTAIIKAVAAGAEPQSYVKDLSLPEFAETPPGA